MIGTPKSSSIFAAGSSKIDLIVNLRSSAVNYIFTEERVAVFIIPPITFARACRDTALDSNMLDSSPVGMAAFPRPRKAAIFIRLGAQLMFPVYISATPTRLSFWRTFCANFLESVFPFRVFQLCQHLDIPSFRIMMCQSYKIKNRK